MNTKISKIEEGITEAQAAAVYFLEGYKEFNTAGYAAVVDIGGATTDISFWDKRQLKWEDSVKFAGSDLLEVVTDLVNEVRRVSKDDASVFSYDKAMRKWPFVHHNWEGRMEDLSTKEYGKRTFRSFSLFYGGICFYIGMHLKREKINEPINQVAFAGNGIRFLEIVTYGNTLSDQTLRDWIKFLRGMLSLGHGLNDNYNTTFIFSREPKLEVAMGLVSNKLEKYLGDKEGTTKKMLGLDIDLDEKKYRFEEWESQKNAVDFIRAKIDFSNFITFILKYKETANKYLMEWKLQLESLPIDFNKQMKDEFLHSLEKRGDEELASSLFFEALKAYMKYQYNL